MTLIEKKKLYKKANAAYFNDQPIMTDADFNRLELAIAKEDPDWKELKKTGAKVGKKVAIKLHKLMPSLAKCYPETIAKWIAKQKSKILLALHKLDGSALQGRYRNGRCFQLATRGDGTTGKDISFLIPFLKLPVITDKSEVTLRMEAVMSNAVFNKKWLRKSEDDKDGFDNPRNAVNGLLNRTSRHTAMADIDMVVLGVYGKTMQEGLKWAHKQGFLTATRKEVATDSDNWEALLIQARTASLYDIDGLVLVPPDQVFDYDSADRPKWTTAYKVNDDEGAVEVTVLKIIEQISRNDRISPKIEITPTKIKGVVVRFATAHNAKWMLDRGIGVGAVIKLVRSGDVIPKIEAVVKPAKKPWVPSVPHAWDGVHYITMERHADADIREILHFFTVLGIEHIARKTVDKLYHDPGICSVLEHLKVFKTSPQTLRIGTGTLYEAGGVGRAMTEKIFKEMQRVLVDEGVSLIKLMNASNCFESFGERKLQAIVDHFAKKGDRNMLKWYVQQPFDYLQNENNWQDIIDIKGMGKTSAAQFFEGVQRFKLWFLPILKLGIVKVNHPTATTDKPKRAGKLSGQRVSWTGYRSKEEEAAVEAAGGTVVSFGSSTTVLLYKDDGKASSKIQKAKDKGMQVTTFDKLRKVL